MRFRARDISAATGGRLVGPDVEVDGVSFDSRSLQPGQLFVPIVAERDGHDFIADAAARGAAAYLTARPPAAGVDLPCISVADTAESFMVLAAALRRRLSCPVVGITGSVGKTSTKDLARAALAPERRVWANERSFNNEQGLPSTIANAPDDTEVLVLEMGMRGHGEIRRLCSVAAPTIGVVTRVAEAHSDRVGGIDGVARAKAELVTSLSGDGVAVLNHDDVRVRAMSQLAPGRVVTFGEATSADVVIDDVRLDDLGRPAFVVRSPWGSVAVRLAVSGRHMAHNAAAALTVAGLVGVDLASAAGGLAEAGLTPMRMQVRRASSGAVVLDDSYNANPTSMRAALDTLASLPASRRIAILGVMAEISDEATEHRNVAEHARGLGIELLAVGTELYGVAPVGDPVAALGSLSASDAVLVKGSRVAALDRVADELVRTATIE